LVQYLLESVEITLLCYNRERLVEFETSNYFGVNFSNCGAFFHQVF